MSASSPEAPSISSFFALPETPRRGLRELGLSQAAPIQAACWQPAGAGRGAARGESLCLHAPTGSGKSLAMLLPAMFSAIWSGRDAGCVVALAPSREVATQHAALAGRLLGELPTVVTSATVTGEGLPKLCDELVSARFVVATPRELCQALEFESKLYVTLAARVEALVLDELDLLMPARKNQVPPATRWQDRGAHPAEALAKLVAKRSRERLQVLAGSATLDKAAKTKLERCLRGSLVDVPLRVVALDDVASLSLTTKPKLTPTIRTTLLPPSIAHAYVVLHAKADPLDVLVSAVRAARPSAAIVFSCSSSGLKVRAVDAALRAAGFSSAVLGDLLWPASARNRRRRAHKRVRRGLRDDRDLERVDNPGLVADDAAVKLNDRLCAATPDRPSLVVADEAVTRGLHLDALDAVFVLGRPANADTYLHLAGRTARYPFDPTRRDDQARQPAGTVVTLARPKDLALLRSWLADLGAAQPNELTLPSTLAVPPSP